MSTRMDPTGLKNAWTEWLSNLGNLAHGPAGHVYKEWEAWFGAQFEKLAKSENFLGTMAKSMENSFLLKSQFDRMMEASVRAMRLPTAGDVELIHRRLDELERRLDAQAEKAEKTAKVESAEKSESPEGQAPKAKRPAPKAEKPAE